MTEPGRKLLQGIAASGGVAVGGAMLLERRGPYFRRRHLAPEAVPTEVARLRRAIDASRHEIEEIRASLPREHQAEYGLILDAHLMMHRDELIVDMAVEMVERDRINAEWALRRTVELLKSKLQGAPSTYFRERTHDVEHVAQHVLRHLTGNADSLTPVEGPSVVVARDLSPADAARLLGSEVQGVVTASGSATSHTAILARALEIPAVVGVSGALGSIDGGETLVVDGLHGHVVVHPTASETDQARARGERYRRFTGMLRARRDEPSQTRDGESVSLMANLELPAEAALASTEGAAGIGLYRTEFMYLDRPALPSEDEQLEMYLDVVQVMRPRPVVFRTFDLGADKLPSTERTPPCANPALGMRALRLSLQRPELLRSQLRAIMRAAAEGPVELMFPLVTTLDELRRAKVLVAECEAELERQGVAYGPIRVGIMIEVPSAALMAERLAPECDFFSVGTNDLVQYALALDRGNPHVAPLAQSLDPAVLRLLEMTAQAATKHRIPLTMCGDMAADPLALPIVLGLGYRSLSLPVAYIPLAREMVRRLSASRAREAAQAALAHATADEVKGLVFERFHDALGDLWAEQGIEAPTDGSLSVAGSP